ncbi:MAG: hypothetical protein KBC83_02635 [Candidatus Moranbacteria bacterium]|nr:hypothetical protein [Candidatus Moranbacteria bacterium]MBP9801538.1 hypothetical protein [Candidatus Moranbacteria bacterium]
MIQSQVRLKVNAHDRSISCSRDFLLSFLSTLSQFFGIPHKFGEANDGKEYTEPDGDGFSVWAQIEKRIIRFWSQYNQYYREEPPYKSKFKPLQKHRIRNEKKK